MFPDTYAYIGILEYGEEGSVGVRFPDLPGCIAVGDTTEQALEDAKSSLALHLYGMEQDGEPIPAPSDIRSLKLEEGDVPAMVEVNMKIYRARFLTRSVKKTLTIPYWLDLAAEDAGLNFSQELQNALKAKLHISG